MKILILGSGAREAALARALSTDPDVSELHAAPGNPGIEGVAACHPLPGGITDGAGVAALATQLGVELVVVGPEVPLVAGVADAVREAGIACFGPSAQAARLEGSKAFAKEVMAAAGVPTAAVRVCTTVDEVAAALDEFGAPHVVKDDGLAAGKGVVVTSDRDEALAHAAAALGARSPEEARVVVEEFLDGPEVSLFCVTDGSAVVPLEPAQDFKRVGEGDSGLNTGGMGAYSPLPWAPVDLVDEVVAAVAHPTVDEMARRGIPFAGLLYIGLALTTNGPRVVEFNARFGDPETQVVLARLATPLSRVLLAAATGTLGELPPLEWRDEYAVTVVVAAENYPGTPVNGDVIEGLDSPVLAGDTPYVLHAGTAPAAGGEGVVSAGGRVLSVVGLGDGLEGARASVYEGVDAIGLRGSHHRRDIALAAAEGRITVPYLASRAEGEGTK
ncbi:MAG: phosphoribosylamine--glycine ligase [Dermatophilus congolensis]|nr:phosphoribosylamine--glycine ligase [Dermatophilus congolensis]